MMLRDSFFEEGIPLFVSAGKEVVKLNVFVALRSGKLLVDSLSRSLTNVFLSIMSFLFF